MTKDEKVMILTKEKAKEYFSKKYSIISIMSLLEEVPKIIEFHSQAKEEIENEEEETKKKDSTQRISDKDIGWFPGDCCD